MKKSKGSVASEILTVKQKYSKNTRGYTSSIQGLCTQRDKKGTEKQPKKSWNLEKASLKKLNRFSGYRNIKPQREKSYFFISLY